MPPATARSGTIPISRQNSFSMSPHSSTPASPHSVTLCIIDTQAHDLAVRALDICRAALPFQEALFISDRPYPGEGAKSVLTPPLSGRADYSRFVMKDLLAHIRTPHVLLIQWDGYITTPANWSEDFLDYDYMGARWGFHKDAHNVGNGGFSLRSRKLLEALQDPEINRFEPEDEMICRHYRPLLESRYGIRFAPPEVADRFSFETTYPNPASMPFGFHGLFNMWMFLKDEEVPEFIAAMPRSVLGSIQALSLGQNFIDLKRIDAARVLLEARMQAFPADHKGAELLSRLNPKPVVAKQVIGRNEPCPCGSGKRFKHCCGQGGADQSSVTPASAMGNADQLIQKAMTEHQTGRLAEAREGYMAALALEQNPVAEHYLGVIEMQEGRPEAGEARIRAALAQRDDIPDFHNNLGLCLRAQWRLEEAVACYRKALDLNPSYAPAWSNIGLDLHKLGQMDIAIDAFNRALALQPDLPQTRFSRALALLAAGDYAQGWQQYEWRRRCPEYAGAYQVPAPVRQASAWQGEPVSGKRLFFFSEQGIGDTIQFIRYARGLAEQGARIILLVGKPHLISLFQATPGVAEVHLLDECGRLPAPDYIVHMLSLPRLCGTHSLSDIPADVPYLVVPTDRRAHWRARLDGLWQKTRIGLAWSGNPSNVDDRNRSCPLSTLAPLFDLPDIAWINLQLGPGREQLQSLPNRILDWGDEQTDYAETTALMSELDLIITVDTSIAHAAGALGLPVWIMLAHVPDFRWMLERRDSPWYPTARLFRQVRTGDWSTVVEAMQTELLCGATTKGACV